MAYRGRNGKTYVLGNIITRGGEGTLYTLVGNAGSVAKIYRPEKVDTPGKRQEKCDKIIAMLDMNFNPRVGGHLLVAWPEDMLFDENGVFQGYIMPYIKNMRTIIWAKREGDRDVLFGNKYQWRYSVAMAHNLSLTIEVMHRNGIVIGDMNPKNIMVNREGDVTLVDADSFNIQTPKGRIFKCTVGMEEVLPAELQGKDLEDPRNRFTEKTDCFALAVHIFDLLCNNCHPFNCTDFNRVKDSTTQGGQVYNILTGRCPYVNGERGLAAAPDMDMLPEYIRCLFRRAFQYTAATAVRSETINNRPSAREWREALYKLWKSPMNVCWHNPQHVYPAIYTKGCPWCAIDPHPDPQPDPPKPTPQPNPQPVKPGHSTWADILTILIIGCALLTGIAAFTEGSGYEVSDWVQYLAWSGLIYYWTRCVDRNVTKYRWAYFLLLLIAWCVGVAWFATQLEEGLAQISIILDHAEIRQLSAL